MSSKVRSNSASYAEFARAAARRLADRSLAERGFAVLQCPLSTHLLGRRIAREYSQESAKPPETELLAWQQSAGQGRGGRAWSSPPGGIYATLIRSLVVESEVQMLPLVVATALCEALNVDLAGRCRLKWPNDLLVDGRKLGGILIDVTSRGSASRRSSSVTVSHVSPSGAASCSSLASHNKGLAVISFGVNHGHLDQAGTTSLEHEAPGRTRLIDLAARLIEAVDVALERSASVAEVLDRYRQVSLHQPGDTLHCRIGDEQVEGVFQGFDSHGFLRLLVGTEECLLTAGELTDDG